MSAPKLLGVHMNISVALYHHVPTVPLHGVTATTRNHVQTLFEMWTTTFSLQRHLVMPDDMTGTSESALEGERLEGL